MIPEPVERCQCGAWVYYRGMCSTCLAEHDLEEAKEQAMKRLISAILRERVQP